MGALKYLFMLVVIGAAMHGVNLFIYQEDHEGNILSETEVPANMLIYAKEDVQKDYYTTALEHVGNAIVNIQKAELLLDDQSHVYIDAAIKDLHHIERRLQSGYLVEEELNEAFARTLNSLAYAYLRASETAMASEHQDEARLALEVAFKQLDYSMRFSTGVLFDNEKSLHSAVSVLLEKEVIDPEQLHLITTEVQDMLVSSTKDIAVP